LRPSGKYLPPEQGNLLPNVYFLSLLIKGF